MLRYRTLIQSREPKEAVEVEASAILSLLETARQRSTRPVSPRTTFTSALVILLREGSSHPGGGRSHRHADQVGRARRSATCTPVGRGTPLGD